VKRRALSKLGISLASLLGAALAWEAWLRFDGFQPLAFLHESPLWEVVRPSADELLGYELRPSASGTAFDCEVRVNALGFRGAERVLERSSDVRRIVVLGDSLTFGNNLAEEDTYCAQLERMFAGQGRAVEVCNLGVAGYDTLQEARVFERRGAALAPDLVVLGFCVNDAGTVSLELEHLERVRAYGGVAFRLRVAQWFALRYERWKLARGAKDANDEDVFRRTHSEWIDALDEDAEVRERMERLRALLAEREGAPPAWSPLPWYTSDAHVGRLRRGVRELGRVTRAAKVPVLLALFPPLKERPYLAAWDEVYALVELLARREGFDVLSLAGAVRSSKQELQILPKDWIHYNAAGNTLMAQELVRRIAERGWLDEAR